MENKTSNQAKRKQTNKNPQHVRMDAVVEISRLLRQIMGKGLLPSTSIVSREDLSSFPLCQMHVHNLGPFLYWATGLLCQCIILHMLGKLSFVCDVTCKKFSLV